MENKINTSEVSYNFKSWTEVVEHCRKYLYNEINTFPTHDGPLEEETETIINHLQKINKYGILTIDSQPGINEYGIFKSKQRAYLDCYMNNNLYKKLKRRISKTEFLIFGFKCNTVETHNFISSIPVSMIKKLKKVEYETYLPIGLDTDDIDIMFEYTELKIKNKIIKNIYSVRLVDPIWGRKDKLFLTIIKLLSY